MRKQTVLITLALFLVWGFTAPALFGAPVTLQWDASTTPGVDGYGVFHKNYLQPAYDYNAPLWTGPGLTCTVDVPEPNDVRTYFVARAYMDGPIDLDGNPGPPLWSDDSNEVRTPDPQKPAPPNLFLQVIIALMKVITGFFA